MHTNNTVALIEIFKATQPTQDRVSVFDGTKFIFLWMPGDFSFDALIKLKLFLCLFFICLKS